MLKRLSQIAKGFFAKSIGILDKKPFDWPAFAKAFSEDLVEAYDYETGKVGKDKEAADEDEDEGEELDADLAAKRKRHKELVQFFETRKTHFESQQFAKLEIIFQTTAAEEGNAELQKNSTVKGFKAVKEKFEAITKAVGFVPPDSKADAKADAKADPKPTAGAATTKPPAAASAAASAAAPSAAPATADAPPKAAVDSKTNDFDKLVTDLVDKPVEKYREKNKDTSKPNYESFHKEALVAYIARGANGAEKIKRLHDACKIFVKKHRAKFKGLTGADLVPYTEFDAEVNRIQKTTINDEYDWMLFVRNVCFALLNFNKAAGETKFYNGMLYIIRDILKNIVTPERLALFGNYEKWFPKHLKYEHDRNAAREQAGKSSDPAAYMRAFDQSKSNCKPDEFKFGTEKPSDFERLYRIREIILQHIELVLVSASALRNKFAENAEQQPVPIITILSFFLSKQYTAGSDRIHYLDVEVDLFDEKYLTELFRLLNIFAPESVAKDQSVPKPTTDQKAADTLLITNAVKADRLFKVCQSFIDKISVFQKEAGIGSGERVPACVRRLHAIDIVQSRITATFTPEQFALLAKRKSEFEFLYGRLDFDKLAGMAAKHKATGGDHKGGAPAVSATGSKRGSTKDPAAAPVAAAAKPKTPGGNGGAGTPKPAADGKGASPAAGAVGQGFSFALSGLPTDSPVTSGSGSGRKSGRRPSALTLAPAAGVAASAGASAAAAQPLSPPPPPPPMGSDSSGAIAPPPPPPPPEPTSPTSPTSPAGSPPPPPPPSSTTPPPTVTVSGGGESASPPPPRVPSPGL